MTLDFAIRAFQASQQASRISRAMAPGLTHLLISVRCLFMASMLTVGMTNAAPVPRAGQMAPKR